MKLANALEGGITGATTLTLLQEALHKIDSHSPRPLLHKSGIIKKLKKNSGDGKISGEQLIKLAGELISNAALFGMTGLGKKKNAVLRGGLLGLAAGLGAAFLLDNDETAEITNEEDFKKKLLTISLYTAGGLLAGVAVKKINLQKK